jgi:hypothetical protein
MVVTSDLVAYIENTLIPSAKQVLQRSLSVRPVTGNLMLTSGTCGAYGGVSVPNSYVTTGATGSDLVVFVTARPTSGQVAAWAIACQQVRTSSGLFVFTARSSTCSLPV